MRGDYIFSTKFLNMKLNFYFKLFNNIKSQHEVESLAYLELKVLFGDIKPINNFVDHIIDEPFRSFVNDHIRIQDIIMMELPYGRVQGFFGQKNKLFDITKLIQRLTYTRELYVIIEGEENQKEIINRIFPRYSYNTNTQIFEINNKILFRFITNQYFFEKSEYISRIRKTKEEIDRDLKILFSHLTKNYYKIPSPSTSKYYRTLNDDLAIREETSLYLNHYMHPYKGKSHPKMIRALINYILPEDKGVVLDNFSGSGTTLLEASLLSLDSLGVEINPLSTLMARVKCQSYKIPTIELKDSINFYKNRLKRNLKLISNNQKYHENITINSGNLESILRLQYKELARIGIGKKTVQKVFIARETLNEIENKKIKDFLLLSLSGAISDIIRRTSQDIIFVLYERINDLYNRLYLFSEIRKELKCTLGNSETICADTRNLHFIKSSSVDGIINSPPYLTALDYIENDYPQLLLLSLVNSWESLDENMVGNPKNAIIQDNLHRNIKTRLPNSERIYNLAKEISEPFRKINNAFAADRITKYVLDMSLTLSEMYRVLKENSKCAIIIGNNHFKLENKLQEIPNDRITKSIAKEVGFYEDLIIDRDVQKSSSGLIKKEKILIFQK